MTKIKVMSENLANKIAAGEVIEKIASVVKELVENSIDAGATSIKVDLVNGGLKEIVVSDNGSGMSDEDAKLCFLRHATSKIIKDDDLLDINTLGFRGEALASIASVSEVLLSTSMGEVGKNILMKGGVLVSEASAPMNKGTKIRVSNLFYNTPARLKYLKSVQYELANCVNFVELLALSKPDISFVLTNDGKVLVRSSGSNNLLKVIHEVYGLEVSSKCLELECENDDYYVKGYICKPDVLRSNKNRMITIINGRVVKNYELLKAINDGYYTYKPDNKYPIVVLDIETDPILIDVNIHPTKQDVKLSKTDELSLMIMKSIKDNFYNNILIPNATGNYNDAVEFSTSEYNINDNSTTVEEYVQSSLDLSVDDNIVKQLDEGNGTIGTLELYPVGLAHGTYIIAQNDEGVYLIDQHAAQERINYEKCMKALESRNINILSMLIPVKIELSTSDCLILNEHIDSLISSGFLIEEFGINTYLVKAHPDWVRHGVEEESIRRIIELVISTNEDFNSVKFNESVAIMSACKMSIKANMAISHDEQVALLNELVTTDNPHNCPHGRPTIIKFSIYQLEKMFKRVM